MALTGQRSRSLLINMALPGRARWAGLCWAALGESAEFPAASAAAPLTTDGRCLGAA